MVKVKSGWTECPTCGARLRADKLKGHMKNVHPKGVRTREARAKIVTRRRTASTAGKWAVLITIIVIIVVVIAYLYTSGYFVPTGHNVGDKPPNFSLEDRDGSTFTLKDHLGDKPILMAFMETTCRHCRAMAPIYQALYENNSARVEFVIVISEEGAKMSDVKAFANEFGLEFNVLYDEDAKVFHKYQDPDPVYNSYMYPAHFIIGKDSRIYWEDLGEQPQSELQGLLDDVT